MSGPDAAMAFLTKCLNARQVGATRMNMESSRSHTIFKLVSCARLGSRRIDAELHNVTGLWISCLAAPPCIHVPGPSCVAAHKF